MARDGLWKQLDAALTWHPEDCNEVITGGSNACIQVQYTFHGVASHAAARRSWAGARWTRSSS